MPTIHCTDKQAFLIEIALDTLSRMVAGQLNYMIDGMDVMRGKAFKAKLPNGETAQWYNLGMYISKELKPLLFPELHPNASYGVGQKEIGDAQVAYEMVKILQNYRSKELDEQTAGVLKHEPLHYSKEPLIEVTDVDDKKFNKKKKTK